MYKYWIVFLMLLPSMAMGQFFQSGGGTGTQDSVGVDTTGSADWGFLYPTWLRKGANITFSISGDTLTIAGPAGAGTADSIGVDTNGDGAADYWFYSTGVNGIMTLRKGDGITLTADTDTLYVAASLGTTIDVSELALANYGDSGDVWCYEPGAGGGVQFYARGIDELAVLTDTTDTLTGNLTILSGKLIFKQADGNDIEGVSKVTGDTIVPSLILSIGGEDYDKLNGTGLTVSSGDLQTTLGTAVDTTEIDTASFNQYVSDHSTGSGGLDSAEVMQIIRDTTYVDSALVGQIIRDSTTAGGLDSAEIMQVIRDTTYIDSALTATIIRDSNFVEDSDVYPFVNGASASTNDLILIDANDSLYFEGFGTIIDSITTDTIPYADVAVVSDSTDLTVFNTDDLTQGSTNLYRADIKADSAGDGTNVATVTQPMILREGTNITLTVINGDTVEIAGPASSGTADSMRVDTSGSGDYATIYSTAAGGAFTLREGTNIDLTVDTDTLYIAGPASSGTADSMRVDTSGSGDYAVLYSTVAGGAFTLREGAGIDFTADTDTGYIASTLGVEVDSNEINDTHFAQYVKNNQNNFTNDSVGWDSSGTPTYAYTYPTMVQEGAGIDITVDTDTAFIASTLGTAVDGSELDTGLKDSITAAYDSSQVLDARLATKPDTSITITGTGSITGGGNLQANRTLDITTTFRDSVTAAYDSSQVLDTRLASKDDYTVKSDTAGDGTNVVTHATSIVLQEGTNITLTEQNDTLTITGAAAGGDDAKADTAGDGTNVVDLGSPFIVQEGTNVTLTVDNDTLTIAATGAGGTSDSIGIDSTSGGGAGGTDTYLYPAHIHPGTYMEFDVTNDTVVIDIDTTDFYTEANLNDSLNAVRSDIRDTITAVGNDNYTVYSDTAGDGSNVVTHATSLVIQEGSNITLTEQNDTLTIAGGAGSGTADSMRIDTSGSGDYAVLYSTTAGGAFTLREGSGIDFTADTDTGYIAIASDGIDFTMIDQTADISSDPALGAGEAYFGVNGIIFEGATANEYEASLIPFTDPSAGDMVFQLPASSGIIPTQTWVDIEIADSLDEYSLTTAIVLRDGSQALTADWAAGAFDITGLAMIEADTVAIGATKIVDFAGQGLSITSNVLAIDSTQLLSTDELTTDSTGTGNLVRASGPTITSPVFSTSMQLPTGTAPTTDAEGEMAWDNDDDAIEVFSGDESESGLIPFYKKFALLISQPDSVQAYSDSLPIFHANALMFPAGIEIDLVSITLEADAAYSLVLQEWNNADPPVYQNVITTIATGAGDSYAEEAPDTDGNLTVGERIYMVLPTTDVPSVLIEVYYHVTAN